MKWHVRQVETWTTLETIHVEQQPHKKKQGRGLSWGICRLTDLCSRISGHIHETCRNSILAPKSSHNFKGYIAVASGRPEEGFKDEKGARSCTI